MRRPTALLLSMVLLASLPLLAKEKNKKKEKRFDPVTVTGVAMIEGNYRGISDDQILELRVGRDGNLLATLRDDATPRVSLDAKLTGNSVRLTQPLPNGKTRTLTGTFMIRTLNGTTAFGLLLEGFDLHPDDTTLIQRVFFARVSP